MSKRAEEKALRAYPIDMQPLRYQDYIDQFGGKTEIDINSYSRRLFQEGYEQAEKDLGWHSVEESLPPVDEEVIVLTDIIAEDSVKIGLGRICFAHIVDPDFTVNVDNISYRPISHNGWNIPDVKYWMPMPKLPKEEEQ